MSQRGTPPLDCRVRVSIATGVSAGIQFLHTVIPNKPLIHGDIKRFAVAWKSVHQYYLNQLSFTVQKSVVLFSFFYQCQYPAGRVFPAETWRLRARQGRARPFDVRRDSFASVPRSRHQALPT